MGGGSNTLFGQNGVVAGGLDVFGDLLDPNVTSNPLALLGTAIKAKNTYDNAKTLTKAGIKNEVSSIATGAITNTIEDSVQIFGLNKVNDTKATQVALSSQNGDTEVADTKTIQKKVDAGNNSGDGGTETGGTVDKTAEEIVFTKVMNPNTGERTRFLNNTDYYAWIRAGKPSEWIPGGGAEQLIITVIPLEN
jgi:hypothetical protein